MRRLDEQAVLQAEEGLRAASLPGEVIILDEQRGVYLGLSDVGLRIWNLIQQPRSVAEVVDRLTAEYDVERERCTRDVLELVAELADSGMVRVHDGPVVKFRALPAVEKRLLFEAWLCLTATRVGLWLAPFDRVRGVLERRAARRFGAARESLAAGRIVFAVNVAGRCVPGTRRCLPQALVGRYLLARYGHACELHYGVARDDDGALRAHAWLEREGAVIVGAEQLKRFTRLDPT